MLFITNRRLIQGTRSKMGRRVGFDLEDNEPSASVFFCRRNADGHQEELTARPFFDALRQMPHRQILLYVHGYNVMPDAAFRRGREIQDCCDRLVEGEIAVVPLIWPCDSDTGILKDYWDDQAAAQQSAVAFSRALQRFCDWRDCRAMAEPCLKHVNLMAHSMGARVASCAISDWSRQGGAHALFRNLFLVAADIPNDSLVPGRAGGSLAEVARNLVVYHAADDFALRTSKVANIKNRILSRRLGHTGPEDTEQLRRNVYSVDCSDFNNAYDRLGHTYFGFTPDGQPGLAIRHMVEAMCRGRLTKMPDGTREAILSPANG